MANGQNSLKVFIDPKSSEDMVTSVIDELVRMNSSVTRGSDDDGNEYMIIKRNNHTQLFSTTNPIKAEFDPDDCDPVLAAKELAQMVDNIM